MNFSLVDTVGRRGAWGREAGRREAAGRGADRRVVAGASVLAAALALGVVSAGAAGAEAVRPKASEVATLRALLALQYPDLRRRPVAATPIRSELGGNTSQGTGPRPDSPVL